VIRFPFLHHIHCIGASCISDFLFHLCFTRSIWIYPPFPPWLYFYPYFSSTLYSPQDTIDKQDKKTLTTFHLFKVSLALYLLQYSCITCFSMYIKVTFASISRLHYKMIYSDTSKVPPMAFFTKKRHFLPR
jgi:hypothetical protein